MQPRGEKFRAILAAELDDLIHDLKDAQSIYGERYRAGEVSGYVLMENTAVLEHEIAGVAGIRAALAETGLPVDATPEKVCGWFEKLCRDTIEHNGYPPGILSFLTRRCGKVVKYVYEA